MSSMYKPEMFDQRFAYTWRFVYVIARMDLRDGRCVTKVGISNTPQRRAMQLDQELGGSRFFRTFVVAAFNTPYAEAVESAIHSSLSVNALGGEWFDISPETSVEAVRREVARACDNFVTMEH